MPVLFILHIFAAIFFAVHAVRSGRNMYWLMILFSVPYLGSLVYFLVEYLPGSKINRGMNKAAIVAGNLLDPEKEVREARHALDLSPSAQNQIRLAKALLARGETEEAVKYFDVCLAGPFGKEPEVLYSAGSAKLQSGQVQNALELAKTLRANCPDYLVERAMLLLGQALAQAGDKEGARAELSAASARFGSVDARAQYAIWAANNGDLATAENLGRELTQAEKYWNAHARSLNRPMLQKVEAAIAAAKRA